MLFVIFVMKAHRTMLNHVMWGSAMEGIAPQKQLSIEEVARFKNWFRSSIWQRQDLWLYWLPGKRHITSRSTFSPKLLPRRLPQDAVPVGRFVFPVLEREFVAALEETIKALGPEGAPA